jgi:short-subunit dehydrogenase
MNVLVVGATSAIAREAARAFAESGARLFLTGRSESRLAEIADDLRVRGAERVETAILDMTDLAQHAAVVRAADESLGELDAVLVAHGTLPDQTACEGSVELTLAALAVNLTSTIALLTRLASLFEERGRGTIAVLTSVAGERGRRSNYVYGTAKAGLNVFLQGLRNRLHGAGVAVVTIKPGFVDTPMTAHLPKNLLFADPRDVGRAVHRAMLEGRDVVYVPWFWRPVMAGIRSIPEGIFKRLKL